MNKKIICTLIIICFIIVSIFNKVYASNSVFAISNNLRISVNGNSYTFGAYNISDNNFVKLRDLAAVLNNTSVNFSIDWNAEENVISLASNMPYNIVGSELKTAANNNETAILSHAKIMVNGVLIDLESYIIDGNTYFKLRDISEVMGFEVNWDSGENIVIISTNNGEDEADSPDLLNKFHFDHNIHRKYHTETIAENGEKVTIDVELYWHTEEMLREKWKDLVDEETLNEIFAKSHEETFMAIISTNGAVSMRNINYVYDIHTDTRLKVKIIDSNFDRLGIVELASRENGIYFEYMPSSEFRNKKPAISAFVPLIEEIAE